MARDEIQDDSAIEDLLEFGEEEGDTKQRGKKVKAIDAAGLHFYGEKFVKFDTLGTIRDLIPQFKNFYYEKRIRAPQLSGKAIIQEFNNTVAYPSNRTFFPGMPHLRKWRAMWDADIEQQRRDAGENSIVVKPMSVHQVLKTRGEKGELVLGNAGYADLEAGVTTLGGELLNDAMQMLRDDQEIGELYDDEVLIKRRNYMVNVFGHVTKLVHGKASLLLKASQEKRENASFLMTLLAKATAGKLSDTEMQSLRTTYTVPVPKIESEVPTT